MFIRIHDFGIAFLLWDRYSDYLFLEYAGCMRLSIFLLARNSKFVLSFSINLVLLSYVLSRFAHAVRMVHLRQFLVGEPPTKSGVKDLGVA